MRTLAAHENWPLCVCLALSFLMVAATAILGCVGGDIDMTDDAKERRIEEMYLKYRADFPDAPEIEAAELDLLHADGALIVDVREPAEFAVSRIPGAISKTAFEQDKERYRDRRVVAYCTVGYRSGLYVQELRAAGWDAHNVKGSLLAYTHTGRPLENEEGETRRLHVYAKKWNLAAKGYETEW